MDQSLQNQSRFVLNRNVEQRENVKKLPLPNPLKKECLKEWGSDNLYCTEKMKNIEKAWKKEAKEKK